MAIAKHYLAGDSKKVKMLIRLDELYVSASRAHVNFKKEILNENLLTRKAHTEYKIRSSNLKLKIEEILDKIRSFI